jgi:hypothetical protein
MLSKGCGYGFQRCGKVRYVDSVLEENEKDDNSLKLCRGREITTKQSAGATTVGRGDELLSDVVKSEHGSQPRQGVGNAQHQTRVRVVSDRECSIPTRVVRQTTSDVWSRAIIFFSLFLDRCRPGLARRCVLARG